MNTPRVKQSATEELFEKVSKYAKDVPIVVVATKMDEFFGTQFQNAREEYEHAISDLGQLLQRCDLEAKDEVQERVRLMAKELGEVEDGRFDSCVAVRCSPRNSKDEMLSVVKSSSPIRFANNHR